jgi:hypothetical protein
VFGARLAYLESGGGRQGLGLVEHDLTRTNFADPKAVVSFPVHPVEDVGAVIGQLPQHWARDAILGTQQGILRWNAARSTERAGRPVTDEKRGLVVIQELVDLAVAKHGQLDTIRKQERASQ